MFILQMEYLFDSQSFPLINPQVTVKSEYYQVCKPFGFGKQIKLFAYDELIYYCEWTLRIKLLFSPIDPTEATIS